MKLHWPISFKNSKPLEEKESQAGRVVSHLSQGQPVWTERDYANFAQEAYVKNAVANRCIKIIAQSAATAKLLLKDKSGDIIDDHPLLDLLRRPNAVNGGAALFEAFYAYSMLDGNTYLEANGPNRRDAPPQELWVLRPDRMEVIAGNDGVPAGYKYSHGGEDTTWMVDALTGKGKILHVKEFHPINDWYGLARTEPAAFAIDRHNAASAHNKALLDNGARPSGALVFQPAKKPDGSEELPPQEVIDLAEDMISNHTGVKNAGKPFIFGGNVKWESMGISPREMDFQVGKDDAGREICTAYGVPHVLVIHGEATYNNRAEARLEFWEETVLPLLDISIAELNNWLVPMFDENLYLEVDRDAISALEPRREAKRESTSKLFEKGIITVDEARDDLQYGPLEDNAVKKVDASVLSALVNSVTKVGPKPLTRYMQSVGLFHPEMTQEEIIAEAILYINTDDLDDELEDSADDEIPT